MVTLILPTPFAVFAAILLILGAVQLIVMAWTIPRVVRVELASRAWKRGQATRLERLRAEADLAAARHLGEVLGR